MPEFFKMSVECVCRRASMTDEEQRGERRGHGDRRTVYWWGPGSRDQAKCSAGPGERLASACSPLESQEESAALLQFNGNSPLIIHRLTRQQAAWTAEWQQEPFAETLYQPDWVKLIKLIKIVGKIAGEKKKKLEETGCDCGASAPALTWNNFRAMGIFHSQPGPKMMRKGRAISSFFSISVS